MGTSNGSVSENFRRMKIVDGNLDWFGYSVREAMERAGYEIAKYVKKTYGTGMRVGIFCGLGNNGGDGFAAARYLAKRNDVFVFLIGKPKDIKTKEARANWDRLRANMKIRKHIILGSGHIPSLRNHKLDVVLDCILGLGLKGGLKGTVKTLVKKMNKLGAKKVAVDVPTGFGTRLVFKDDTTLSLHFSKKRGAKILDIGIPHEWDYWIGPGHVKALSVPAESSRKGQNGVLTIVGGSNEYHGAPILSAIAASRFVDMVYYYSPSKLNEKVLAEMKSKLLTFVMPNDMWMDRIFKRSDVVLVGNGLGDLPGTKKLVNDLLKRHGNKKFVLDADALRVVEKKYLRGAIVTPHKGEFKVLFGMKPSEKNVLRAAKRYGCIVVLKGRVDLVSDGSAVWKNFTGNAEMTRGGTGDVLAGLIGALACTNDMLLAAQAGVFLNGLAGDLLKEKMGKFNAEDLANGLWRAYRSVMNSK